METLRFLMTTSFYPPYHLGGDAVHIRYLAEALSTRGHEVHVEYAPAALELKRSQPATDYATDDRVRTHPIPSSTGPLQPLAAWTLGAPRSVQRHHSDLVANLRPDVVHYHNLSLLGLDLLNVPTSALKVYTAHDYWVRCPRNDLMKFGRHPCERTTCMTCTVVSKKPPQLWRYRRVVTSSLHRINVAIAPSRFLQGKIANYLPCPVVHIPNFAPDPNPSGTCRTASDFYLYVGRLEWSKGIPELAEAIASYAGPYRFVVVGKGTQDGLIEKARAKHAGRTDLRGWISREELNGIYAAARAVLLPSVWYENSPLVAIEALCWGTPLLCSNLGALPELTYDGTCGRSFPPTPKGILDGLERFEREGLADGQRRSARNAYERFHTAAEYLAAYGRLLELGWHRQRASGEDGVPPGLSSSSSTASGSTAEVA